MRSKPLFVGVGLILLFSGHPAAGQKYEPKLPDNTHVQRFDFEQNGIEKWKKVEGNWTVEDMPGAPSGKRVLMLRPKGRDFNVIVAPGGPYTDIDVSVRFKPISGREDASGGIVFRFSDGKYYVVRANALEDNFRLYYYDNGRRQLAAATVQPPALGQWHHYALSWPAIKSRPISTENFCLIIETRALKPARSAYGQKPIA